MPGSTRGPGPGPLAALLARLPYAKRLELEGRDPGARYASLAGIALALRGVAALRGDRADAGRAAVSGRRQAVPRRRGRASACRTARGRVGVALRGRRRGWIRSRGIRLGVRTSAAATRLRLARWTATEAVLKAAGRGLRDARAVELDESLRVGRVGGASFHLVAGRDRGGRRRAPGGRCAGDLDQRRGGRGVSPCACRLAAARASAFRACSRSAISACMRARPSAFSTRGTRTGSP